MNVSKTYADNLATAQAVFGGEGDANRRRLCGKRCLLFKSTGGHHAGCAFSKEMVAESTLPVISPCKKTRQSRWGRFGSENSLGAWPGAINLFHGLERSETDKEPFPASENGEKDMPHDRKESISDSLYIDVNDPDRGDACKSLSPVLMSLASGACPTEGFWNGKTRHDETARMWGVVMGNYYNIHE